MTIAAAKVNRTGARRRRRNRHAHRHRRHAPAVRGRRRRHAHRQPDGAPSRWRQRRPSTCGPPASSVLPRRHRFRHAVCRRESDRLYRADGDDLLITTGASARCIGGLNNDTLLVTAGTLPSLYGGRRRHSDRRAQRSGRSDSRERHVTIAPTPGATGIIIPLRRNDRPRRSTAATATTRCSMSGTADLLGDIGADLLIA